MGVISVQLSLLAVPFPAMQGMRSKEKRVVLSISMFMLMPPAWHTRDFSLFATSVNARSVRGGDRKTSRQSLTLWQRLARFSAGRSSRPLHLGALAL